MTQRCHVRVPIETIGPLANHTGGSDAQGDTMLRVDAGGRPLLPGTTIAGALRAACQRRYGAATTNALFGYVTLDAEQHARKSQGMVAGVPSRVSVFDAASRWSGPSQLRHHVGMDRATLTARRGILFDERVWPEGLRFDLRVECDQSDLAVVQGAIEELLGPAGGIGAGPCPLGRPRDAGANEVTVVQPFGSETVAAAAHRWEDPAADPWPSLRRDEPGPVASPTTDRSWLELKLVFELTSPLAARVPLDISSASAHDNLPFAIERITEDGLKRALGYPGSSLKGRLRQRAEYLVAHTGQPAPHPWATHGERPHPVQFAFGHAPGGRQQDAQPGASGRIRCTDFRAARRPSERPASLSDIEPVWSTAPAETHPLAIVRDRVAIDRMTGSTYVSAKFDDTLIHDGCLLTGSISIIPYVDDELDFLDLALVAAGLRDLGTGMCGLGGSSHSGYGDIRLYAGEITVASGEKTTTMQLEPTDDDPVGLPPELASRAQRAWQHFVEEATT